MQDFANKTAFVTGGASGVGLGIAKALAKAGANVAIGDIQQNRLNAAEQQLKEKWQKQMRQLKKENSAQLKGNIPKNHQRPPPRQERHQKKASGPKSMADDESEDQT